MSGDEQEADLRGSNPNASGPSGAAGGMGVSSERVGHAGPGQESTDGVLDSSRVDGDRDVEGDGDEPTEQSADGAEVKPTGLRPKSGYPSLDPRSKDKPFQPGPDV